MDHRGGRGGGGRGGGGGGGGGGGNSSRTDLLAAGRKKLQQFRKKKGKREPGKKAEADAEAEAEEGAAKAEEYVPEPKSPVGLKFLAGEGGSSGSTPFEEAERSQAEQCNGEGPGTVESSSVENADAVQEQEARAADSDALDVSTSEQGIPEQRESRTADGEDLPIQATSGDDGGDLVEGAQLGQVHVDEKLPDLVSKDDMELNTSSQHTGADDDSNQLGEHQQVEMDPVDRPTSSSFEEVSEVPIPSQGTGVDNNNDEAAQETVMDVSERPLDGDIQHDVEPTISAEIVTETAPEEELTVAASDEIPESTIRRCTEEETDGVDNEAVQENPNTAHVTDEAVTTNDLSLQARSPGAMDMPLCEQKGDPALFRSAALEGIALDHFEDIQRHMYSVTLSRDFLQLQLDEAAGLYSDVTQRSCDETTKLQLQLKETEESKLAVSEELHQCRHELSEVNTAKGELELLTASLKEEINTSNLRCAHLESELHSSKENTQQIQSELADSRLLLEALQKENLELTASLAFEKEAQKAVEEQRDHLSSDNRKLLSELSGLELSLASMKEEMNAGSSRCEALECELRSSNENLEHTLTELANCRALLESLQKDNLELSANFASEKEAKKKLEEDNLDLCDEKGRLSSDLSELNDKLQIANAKHKQLESHVKDTETYFGQLTEQLIEENLYLSSSADIYQSVIKDLHTNCNVVLGKFQNAVHQENELHLDSPKIATENAERAIVSPALVSHGNSQRTLNLSTTNDSCNTTALQSLKGHLEVAKGDLHDLEKLLERISSRSDGRVLVSKLIKSFEPKGNENDTGPSEGEHDDLRKSTREMVCHLGEKFMAMSSDITQTEDYVTELCNKIELSIKSTEQHDIDRQQIVILVAKMNELAGKLSNYKDAVDNLQNQVTIVQQDANSNSERLTDQVELLQKDASERISILEKERTSLSDLLSEVTSKLTSLGHAVFPSDYSESDDLSFRALSCVDLCAASFQSLQEKLEAAQIDNSQLNSSLVELRKANCVAQERSEHAFEIVKKLYDSLQELLHNSLKSSDEFGTEYSAEEPIESQYGRLMERLKNLLHDHHSMLSTNADLESRLLSKCEEVEELNMRCSSLTKTLNDVCVLNEELKSASLSKNATQDELHSRCLAVAEKVASHSANHSSAVVQLLSDRDEGFSKEEDYILTTLLPCIEEGVASCIEKYENAAEEIHLSKICLQEISIFDQIPLDKWSYPLPTLIREEILPKLCELQDRIDQLDAQNIQLETEIPVFRDGMKKLDEALGTSRDELQKKVSEFEQLDQKLTSVKEKLSIAVAKGKGLIVQRDSLKQSLLEKSGEVEKLTQELQLKETMLKELEAKLKSYTEADRIEALESELSYIRNSATALRDSFLLKDSVLQRIEEALEDLDLPEQFHSRDIVDKIELLSKMAVGNSFTLPDGDKRSSVDGHSGSGVAMDVISDEQNSNSNPVSDELKSKYEELHRRFYELAEHNNMLEQSLVERNNLIQKWEEVLGQISIPPQYRTLEAEDKIAWLGNRLLEVEQERDSLQLKIEHLEDSSEMLIADLEESHKRISELSAEVVAIKAEKDFFSQSLEKLRFEFLGLSEKAVQDEFVRDNLRKDLSELQEKLAEKTEESRHFHEMDIEIHKLLSLVQNTLQDGSNSEISSGDTSAISCLGKLLRKLLDDYDTLLSKSTEGNFADREVQLEDIKPSDDASTSDTGINDKEIELNSLNNELDHARDNLALVEQQRDEAVEKAQSLLLEIETLHAQINKLQESDAEQMQKYQSLVLELESMGKQRDNLQEQLNREEQKCTSLREKLNVAVRKGKGLVQHRDSLKQTMEEMNAVIEKLKDERKQHIESLETEKSSLMDRLAENEKSLHETNQYLSGLLNALNKVDVAREFDVDPIAKVEHIAKFCLDLQATVVSSQNEVKKSKRATELLLAELNEAHERADNLQEELVKAEAALSESAKQYSVTESARADAVRHLEHIMHAQSQTRRKQVDHLMELNSTSSQLREVCFELSHHLVNAFSKDVDLICYMENFMKSSGKWMDGSNMMDVPIASRHVLSNRINNKKAHVPNAPLEIKMDDTDERQILHHLAIACHALSDCVKDCNDLKRSIDEHGFSVEQKATELFDVMSNLQNRLTSQHNELESLRAKFVELQSEMKEREEEIVSAHKNMSLLYEACTTSVAEIEGMTNKYPVNQSYAVEHSADKCIKSIVEQLVLAVKTSQNNNDGSTKELKATVLELQQELQSKDIQISTISSELSYQLRAAESSAKQLSVELEDARMEVHNLAEQVDVLNYQNKALETQVNELKNMESVASEQHGRIKELTDELSRKDQEIEGLMQALDEEEKELEVMENKSQELEQMLQEKEIAFKSAEISRTKALAKLATTVDKFDELHGLSENLLAEVENLQSQLQERDSEISFLRQEVTRSTNELLTTEESNKKYSSQINDFIKWMETALLQFGVRCDYDSTQVPVYMDMLGKKIGSLIAESDDLRVVVQSKDSLLQVERTKMEELMRKSDALEASLSQKDSQIGLLRRDRASSQLSRSINLPGTSEIEQMNDKAAVVTQLRGVRKVNNDQVAIDVEMEKDKPLDDEDDDKAHGFKSLTMSRFVPKFTRPISDRIDGMWVSGDRLFMRQPTLRLGILIYWIALHALLASFI